MAEINYEACIREYFQRAEAGRIVHWRYTADRHGLYEGIVPEDFNLPAKETLDALWTTLEEERAAREIAKAQRAADLREVLGAKAAAALTAIDADLAALGAATTFAQVRPIIENLLRRQKAHIKATMYFEELI